MLYKKRNKTGGNSINTAKINMRNIAQKALSAKWNGKIYGKSIYVNNEKIEIADKLSFIKELVKLESESCENKSIGFMKIADFYNINLPSLAKEKPECKSIYADFINGDFESLFLFFKTYASVKSEEDFYLSVFISPLDGSYKSF